MLFDPDVCATELPEICCDNARGAGFSVDHLRRKRNPRVIRTVIRFQL